MKSKFIPVENIPELDLIISLGSGDKLLINYFVKEVLENLPREIRRKIKTEKENNIFSCCGQIYIEDNKYICSICGQYEEFETFQKKKESRDYLTIGHCRIWLNRLQGKDIINNTELMDLLIDKAKKKCTISNCFSASLIDKIKCSDVRNWLKVEKKTKYNIFIPSLHRIITRELGSEIVPPQFSSEEEMKIIKMWDELSRPYCYIYNSLKQNENMNFNNPSYGHLLVNIVEHLFNDNRAKSLRNYVHRNSTATMELRDKTWDIIKEKYLG